MDIVLALSVTSLYLVIAFLMNKYGSSDKKTPKQMLIDSSAVFLSVFIAEQTIDYMGFSGKKGNSVIAAFTSNPEF